MRPLANLYKHSASEFFFGKPRTFFKAGFLLLVLLLHYINGFSQDPFIPKYDAVKRSERCFTVTWETYNQFGAVWWADKVDFSQDTAFNFVVYMGDRDGNGADGLAFVMHQDPRDITVDPGQQVIIGGAGTWDLAAATGDDGGGLGFAMHQSRVGPNTIPGPHGPGDDPENHKIQPSVAVEMDTWNNTDVPDGRNGTDANGTTQPLSPFYGWDHTAVIYNGDLYGGQQIIEDALGNTGRILPLKPSYAYGTGNNPDGSVYHNIEDDRCYMFQIRWITNPDGTQTLQLWADVYNGTTNLDGLQMIMTHTDDMIGNVFNGNPVMRFGFTGSTGGSINEQTICLLGENLKPFAEDDYASIPLNTSTVIDVEANDNDPDGDQLHVPVIIVPPNNGQAVIFDSLGINFMRYTPNTNFVGLDTLQYVTCDVNSIKCYAKCDTAFVYINVGCIPFDVDLSAISPNLVCTDSVPANGIASANVDATFMRGTLWYEGFEDLASGTTVDYGTSAWSTSQEGSDCRPGNNLYVQNFKFRTKVVTGGDCEIVFVTEEIDISNVTDVNVTIDFETSNATYEDNDYIETYYILDGGPETMFTINGRLQGTFGAQTVGVNNLNGSTLQIVIRAKSNHSSEEYYWDNIHFTAIGAGVPDVTYNWYRGDTPTGPIIFEGAINNNLHSGAYTVVAIDNLTGCPSNPATIVIDSAGYQVPGGFISQLSPFTNCELPYDGALGAGVIIGNDTIISGYSFEWYFQEDPKISSFIQRTGPIAQNLESREYTVVITELATGCDTTINAEVPNAVALPLITATKIADIASCVDPDSGIGQATVGGISAGYRFEWYAGPAIGGGPPDFTGTYVNTFPAGTYTVRAIDSLTSCPSDPATITIDDISILPIPLVTVDSEQTSCDPANPTGQLSAAVDETGTPTTSGYTFNWYRGLNNIIPARPGYAGGPVADGLEAGTYRLVVVEDGTLCTAIVDTLIQDMTITPPDITLAGVDVNSCDAPNGQIIVTLDASLNPSEYHYKVYRGNGVIEDSLFMLTNQSTITGVGIGNYTVVAVNNVTQCASNPETITINDATVLPLANMNISPQVACDPGLLTGSITAVPNTGIPTDYDYFWNDVNGPITPSSADGATVSGLDSGSYSVSIVNKITQCENTYFPVVHIDQIFPVESVRARASTFCAPNGNGELYGSILNQTHPNYSYIWRNGAGVVLSETTATVTGREPGDYSLQIRDDNTGCLSNIAPVIVYDSTVTPTPVLVATNNSSCDITNPNGQIGVTGTNEGIALSSYTYAWFDNSNNDPKTNVSGVGEIVNGLDQGTYRLEIENNTTGCSNSVLSQIIDINIKPVITTAIVTTPATRCDDPYMSTAEVTEINGSSDLSEYTFTWISESNVVLLANSPNPKIEDISDADGFEMPAGNYTVIAYNSFNCESDPVPFVIGDAAVDPVFTISPFNNTSCDPSQQIGSLVASRTDNSPISQYEWFNQAGSIIATTFTGDSVLLNLNAGTYSVQVTDALTACTSRQFASIQNAPANNPVISNTYVNGLTSCVDPNGEFNLVVNPIEQIPALSNVFRSYTFYSVNNSTIIVTDTSSALSTKLIPSNFSDNAVSIDKNTDPGYNTINAGFWTSIVVDNFTKCISDPITISIGETPEIIITAAILNNPASCLGNDGALEISAESILNNSTLSPETDGFLFTWNLGAEGTDGALASATVDTKWQSTATSLESRYYHISIEDLESGCVTDTAIYLFGDNVPTLLSQLNQPSTQCDPANGELIVEVLGGTFGIGKDYSDYDFILFEGNTFDENWPANGEYRLVDGPSILDPIDGPAVFPSDLEPGIYTVVARENTGANCFGEPLYVEIELDFEFPEFSFLITPDKSCDGGTGTGQLAEVSPELNGHIDHSWHSGTNASTPQITTASVTPADLKSGNYYLISLVTSNIPNTSMNGTIAGGLGCIQDSIISVPKVLDLLTLDVTNTDNNNCIPFDGSITINNVLENGSGTGLPGGYIGFTLHDDNLNPITSNDFATPWTALAPGQYYVNAQNDLTKCYVDFAQITIEDLSQRPEISVAITNPDYACDPLLANGELEAFATGGSQDIAQYEFKWYLGSIDPMNEIFTTPLASGLSANNSSQQYIVQVTDLIGPNLGCVSTRQATLLHQPTTITITSVLADPQTICGPNGQIQVETISEYDPFTNTTTTISQPAPFTGFYNAVLYESDLTTLSPPDYGTFNDVNGRFINNVTLENEVVPAGTYYVRAQNLATGCGFGPPTQVVIRDISRRPVISAILDSPDFACFAPDPNNPGHTGQLTATAIGGSDGDIISTNFSIEWTSTLTGLAAPGGPVATNLWPDTYILTVTDNDGPDQGCISTREYIVPSARRNIQVFASGGDQTICNPDGQVQIDSITVNGVKVAVPESTAWSGFLLDQNRNNLNAPESGFVSDPDPFRNISAGTYYTQVQEISTQCYSNTDLVVIYDASTDPVISVSLENPQYSRNPNPLSWTGALLANVREVDGSVPAYDIEWYQGIGTSNSINQQSLDVDSLDRGLYTISALNPNTGCVSEYYVLVPYVYLEPVFLTALTPQTVCAPNNGSIEITDITLEGNPDDLDDYDFSFYHHNYSSGSAPDSIMAGDNSGTFYNDINTGSYYIVAKENWWWVESYPVMVEIIDSTSNPIITFSVSDYHPVTSCDQTVFSDGALGIDVYEDPNNPYVQGGPYTYSFTWISEATGQPIPGENSNTISGLMSGNYTVLVVNQTNNCEAQRTFTIEDASTIPVVVASQTPNTNCDLSIANGIVTSNVINTTNSYIFQWFTGSSETAAPDYSGKTWYDRVPGNYTVVAIDQLLSTCKSAPVTVEVKNDTKYPVIVVNEISPVTNCDPERANGVLSAVTQDGINGHSFTWSLDGELIATGPVASNLGLFKYDLVVINNTTRCETSMQAGPSALQSLVPAPLVDILNDRTSCLSPDGIATASIAGNVVDYIFRYYKKSSGEELSNYFQDYKIYDLDTSTYLVTAEDRTTGCVSAPTEFAIANETYFPEIDVIVLPSSCMEPTGQAEVILSDMTRDFSVTWIGDNGFEAQEKELVFIPIGKYVVIVEGTDGCTSEAEAEVKGDIIIYNAVSANNDGLNEFFQILCMEYFLNNNVKIFNRAGMLVYEQDYYDPTDPNRRFEGFSNKGASVTGTELPIGTYFYVVDKSDGSKPKVGYLELNR